MSSAYKQGGKGRMDVPGLMVLALGVRLLFMVAMPRVVDTADGIHYIEGARNILAWDWGVYDPKIPWGYPALGAVAGLLFSDMEWACRVVSLIFSVLLIHPVYRLSREMHGRGAACLAGILVAVWPWLADYGCRVGTESVALYCWVLGVWSLYRGVTGSGWVRMAWPLPLVGLWLVRPEGMFIYIAALLPVLVLASGNRIRALLPYGIVGAVVLAFSLIFNQWVAGEASANYRVSFILEEFDVFRFVSTSLKTVTEVLPIMLGPVLLPLIGVGLFMQPSEKRKLPLEFVLLYFVLVQWVVTLPVLSPAPRYLMAPIVVLSLWAAAGAVLIGGRWKAHDLGKRVWWLPAMAAVGMMVLGMVTTLGAEHVGRRPREPYEYKVAGQWMKENLEPGLIFTRKPQVGFYADMASTGPALEDSLAEALGRAQEAGAKYLVVDERYGLASMRGLLNPDDVPKTLVLLETFDLYPEARVVVYKLVGE